MQKGQLDEVLTVVDAPTRTAQPHVHAGRLALTRRGFLGSAAGATGAVLGSGLVIPLVGRAESANATPKPIPGGTTVGGQLFHFNGFGPGQEPASITDFEGVVGVADVRGTGTATHADGTEEALLFDTDMRFMKGHYVARDGAVHKGTFGFV